MMRKILYMLALVATPALAQAPAKTAQKAPTKEPTQAELQKRAKVAEPTARATALKAVPGGKVDKYELEEENGKLIYSYDIKVAGKEGIEEVAVDAVTGKMLSHEHESPAKEKEEADADKGKAKAPPKKPDTPKKP